MAASDYYYPEHSHHRHGSSTVYSRPTIVEESTRGGPYSNDEYALVEVPRDDRRSVSTDRRHHHHHRHHRDSRSSRRDSDASTEDSDFQRTRSHSVDSWEKAAKSSRREEAAKAALAGAAIEAFRSRKEPGGLLGKQALTRAATAAVTSGAIDYFIDRKEGPHESSKKHIAESVVGGLLAQRVIQGKSRDGGGHGGGIGELIALGAAAIGGDKLINHESNKRRSRAGSSASRDSKYSRDSSNGSHHSHHRRRSSSSRRYDD